MKVHRCREFEPEKTKHFPGKRSSFVLKNSGISIREKTYLKHKFYFVRMKEMYCEPGG